MGKFPCAIDTQAETFCLRIARRMKTFFEISEDEAIGRVNEFFSNTKIGGPAEIAYHRVAEDWAKLIYYEEGTWYWVDKWMKEHTPKPRPYPNK